MRLLLDPLQRVVLLLKTENRIDLAATPQHANGMALADPVAISIIDLASWLGSLGRLGVISAPGLATESPSTADMRQTRPGKPQA